MENLEIDLKHCYGIKALRASLNFSHCSAVAIYAPNGSMKSSLAEVFRDIAANRPSGDRIFTERASVRSIRADGADISGEQILVVEPYDQSFSATERSSTLLVNAAIRKDYESSVRELDKARTSFLDAVRKQSGTKKDVAREISSAFTASDDKLDAAIQRIEAEISSMSASPFSDVPYDLVLDEKVLSALGDADAHQALSGYVTRLNELLSQSQYFHRDKFNYFNAAQIAKSLDDNGFFNAKHTLKLNGTVPVDVPTRKEFEDIIKRERDQITTDPSLKKQYDELSRALAKNANVRAFESYISGRSDVLAELSNIKQFKENLWKNYISAHRSEYDRYLTELKLVQAKKTEIEAVAERERTDWEGVIDIFNSRFHVPFRLYVKNKARVILGIAKLPELGFKFQEGDESRDLDRSSLLQSLSTGEKRAFYLLNIIFEIEARRKASEVTLVVLDDVADSFDYKNKYAIVQYLKDIAETENFVQIILTHNFDFFRTIQSRLVSYSNCLVVRKTDAAIEFKRAEGIKNVLINEFKVKFRDSRKFQIASLPFMRNLIEYTRGENAEEYKKLTALLHLKPDTGSITVSDYVAIYDDLFGTQLKEGWGEDLGESALDAIFHEADECVDGPDCEKLEVKVLLSLAARLSAEGYMIQRINDENFSSTIESNQTAVLLKKLKEVLPTDPAIKIVERVILMTPENIHLNSFMYEPIIDMSADHLTKLYKEMRQVEINLTPATS